MLVRIYEISGSSVLNNSIIGVLPLFDLLYGTWASMGVFSNLDDAWHKKIPAPKNWYCNVIENINLYGLIPVMFGFEWSVFRNTQVGGLFGC